MSNYIVWCINSLTLLRFARRYIYSDKRFKYTRNDITSSPIDLRPSIRTNLPAAAECICIGAEIEMLLQPSLCCNLLWAAKWGTGQCLCSNTSRLSGSRSPGSGRVRVFVIQVDGGCDDAVARRQRESHRSIRRQSQSRLHRRIQTQTNRTLQRRNDRGEEMQLREIQVRKPGADGGCWPHGFSLLSHVELMNEKWSGGESDLIYD